MGRFRAKLYYIFLKIGLSSATFEVLSLRLFLGSLVREKEASAASRQIIEMCLFVMNK